MTIDKNVFLNGTFPGLKSNNMITFPQTSSLIHFNWLVGNEKEKYMKNRKNQIHQMRQRKKLYAIVSTLPFGFEIIQQNFFQFLYKKTRFSICYLVFCFGHL